MSPKGFVRGASVRAIFCSSQVIVQTTRQQKDASNGQAPELCHLRGGADTAEPRFLGQSVFPRTLRLPSVGCPCPHLLQEVGFLGCHGSGNFWRPPREDEAS